jgi:hypothetical protein
VTRYYVVGGKFVIPNIVFWAVASWVIALITITIIGFGVTFLWSKAGFDILKALPQPLSILLGLAGAYAALGAICLYVTMWVYWIAVERSPLPIRAGWLIALLVGLAYGALLYAVYVWRTNLTIAGPPDLAFSKPGNQ